MWGGAVRGGVEDEGVIQEGAGVEEDGFGFEEELGEEGEVLRVQLRRISITSRLESGAGCTLWSSPSSW